MSIESQLYARLAATAGVLALLGDPPRIYPAIVPQEAPLPHGRYQRVFTERPKAFTASPGLSSATFQVDVWATSHEQAKAIADAIRVALDYWIDRPNGIHGALVDNELDDFEEDREEFRRMLMVDVHTQGVDA